MSITPIDSWAVDLAEVTDIHRFVGSEGVLAIIASDSNGGRRRGPAPFLFARLGKGHTSAQRRIRFSRIRSACSCSGESGAILPISPRSL